MRRFSVWCGGLALLAVLSLAPNLVAAETYSAVLTGDQEVPPVDTDAFGRAFFVFFSLRGEDQLLTMRMYRGLSGEPTGVHIHLAPEGLDGPIVLDFANGVLFSVGYLTINLNTAEDLEGLLEGQTLEDLQGVFDDGNAYINLHTEQNPGGENRGQIEPENASASESAAAESGGAESNGGGESGSEGSRGGAGSGRSRR